MVKSVSFRVNCAGLRPQAARRNPGSGFPVHHPARLPYVRSGLTPAPRRAKILPRTPLAPETVPDSSALDGLMEDLMESGAFGNSSRFQRLSAAYIYASTEGKGSPVRRLFLLLFPPAVRLSSRYPFLNRRPWLLPAAWTMRIFRFAKELLLSDHTLVRRSARRGQKRLAVMKKLGIKSDLKNP